MARGFFLTFEGLDGSGKSTQLRRLAAVLTARGEPLVVTRQPGGTHLGDRIRALLLDPDADEVAPRTELALMFADRAQTIAQVIEPALGRGETVLCDRFTDSTEAYQGGGRGLGTDLVLALHRAICGSLRPDLTILLLSDPGASLVRARRRNERYAEAGAKASRNECRFEQENAAFYQRVFDAYRAIAAREPDRVAAIEGDRPIEQIQTDIVRLVSARLRQRANG